MESHGTDVHIERRLTELEKREAKRDAILERLDKHVQLLTDKLDAVRTERTNWQAIAAIATVVMALGWAYVQPIEKQILRMEREQAQVQVTLRELAAQCALISREGN